MTELAHIGVRTLFGWKTLCGAKLYPGHQPSGVFDLRCPRCLKIQERKDRKKREKK